MEGGASLPSVSFCEATVLDIPRRCSVLLPDLGQRPICQSFSGQGSGMTRRGSDWEWVPCPRDAMRVVTLSNDTRAQGRNGGWMGSLQPATLGIMGV